MKVLTIPNGLTVLRILISVWVLSIVVLYDELEAWLPVVLTAIAVAFSTDWLDGRIARAYPSQQSELGVWLDPPADKLAVFAAMVFVVALGTANSLYEFVCFSIILVREVGMLVWRWLGGANLFPVNQWGKWKTGFQMGALLLYGLVSAYPGLYALAVTVLLVATVLTAWSLVVYAWQKRPSLA